MLLSVANSRPRNLESVNVGSLYPDSLRESASTLVSFIERYYEHLNSIGLPSGEIANITRDKDIDIVSNKYLTEIQSLIARNIPNSRAVDKVTLYRIIIQYYRTRGSEDSIHTFFKLFFDEIVDIFYPRDYLFDLSGGRGAWAPIDIPSLRTSQTNPNKSTLEVTSDAPIGPGAVSSDGSQKVVLQSVSKTLWTLGGGPKSFALPYIERTNISNEGETPVYRWVYRYRDVFELYSTTDSSWPDVANWETWTRNIEYSSVSTGVSLLESGAYSSLEDLTTHDLENVEGAGEFTTKNLTYDRLTIRPIVTTTEDIELLDESGRFIVDEGTTPAQLVAEGTLESGNEVIDLAIYGLGTEDDTQLVSERGESEVDNGLITEEATDSIYSLESANVEYTYRFAVVAIPEYSVRYGDLIHSLEDAPTPRIYRVADLDPITWVEIDANSDVWTYEDNKSFASDLYKLHDGEYWQKYSYRIRCALPYDEWGHDYLRFVHPAGLKLFSAILYEFAARTEWRQPIDYVARQPQDSYLWLEKYNPPSLGYHTPRSQPGWLTANERLLKFIFTVLKDMNAPETLVRAVLLSLQLYAQSTNPRNRRVYEDYQGWIKYLDPNELICGVSDKTIAEASAEWDSRRRTLFSNISSFVSFKILDNSYYPWYYSELIPRDSDYEAPDPFYNEGTVDGFDTEMIYYRNSSTPDKAPLIYRYALESQTGDDFVLENSSAGLVTEGQTHVWASTLFPHRLSVYENEPIRFYGRVSYIPDGTTLYWDCSRGDLSPVSGECVVRHGVISFRTLALADGVTEAPHTVVARLRQGSLAGPILATSEEVTIVDNLSVPSYEVSSDAIEILEGGTITFTITTINVPNGRMLYYTTTNYHDLTPNSGSIQIESGSATIVIKANSDIQNGENESFQLQIREIGIDGPIVATSPVVSIINTFPLWSFESSNSILSGFSVTTTPAAPIQIGWDDYTPITTIPSGGVTTHTYEATPVAFALELDSDGDGWSDTQETLSGTDPNNPDSYPISVFNVFRNI